VPRFGLHWNVIAWWEWSDVACLDALESTQPPNTTVGLQHAVQYLTQPCHRDTDHLTALVKAMCDHGYCPVAVYHDVDYVYNTGYAISPTCLQIAILFHSVQSCSTTVLCSSLTLRGSIHQLLLKESDVIVCIARSYTLLSLICVCNT
jgi:hypothetical protein